MSLLKPVLLFLLFKLSFGFFLNIGFLSGRSTSMSEPSLSSSFKATQTAACNILIYCEIVLAYKTKEEDLRDLYFLRALFMQVLTNLI
jgi:hypothetical protein